MKKSTIFLGVAALAGIGYIVGKKLLSKTAEPCDDGDENSCCCGCSCEEDGGSKIRKASMFAVGAIKTGADKVAEGINEIATEDMVKKGEATTEDLKKEIDDLKSMLVSINGGNSEAAEDTEASEEEAESEPNPAAEVADNTAAEGSDNSDNSSPKFDEMEEM